MPNTYRPLSERAKALYGEAVAPPQNDYSKIREVVHTVFNGRAPIVAPSEIQLTDVNPPLPAKRGEVRGEGPKTTAQAAAALAP